MFQGQQQQWYHVITPSNVAHVTINRGQSLLDTCLEYNSAAGLLHVLRCASAVSSDPIAIINTGTLKSHSATLRCLLNPACTDTELLRILLYYNAPTTRLPTEPEYLAPLSLILRRTQYGSKHPDTVTAVAMGRVLIEHGVAKLPYEVYTRPFKRLVAGINRCKQTARTIFIIRRAKNWRHLCIDKAVLQRIARCIWETRTAESIWCNV